MESKRRGASLQGTELSDPLLGGDDHNDCKVGDLGFVCGGGDDSSGGGGGSDAPDSSRGGGDSRRGSEDGGGGGTGGGAPGSPGLTPGHTPFGQGEWRIARSMSRKLSLVRRQVGDELKANALERAARKSRWTRLREGLSWFLRRYEYGVVVTLALAVVCIYSAFMSAVYDQLVNLTSGEFDSLVLTDSGPLAGAGAMLFLLTVIVCYMTLRLMYSMSGESVGLLHSAQIYFLTIMYFSSLYMFLYLTVDESFSMDTVLKAQLTDFMNCPDTSPGPRCTPGNRMLRMNCLWFYFATTTQTGVGFGDISPSSPISQVASDIQMLLGMVYSVYILGHTVRRITNADSSSRKRKPRTQLGKLFSAVAHNRCVTQTRRLLRRFIFVVSAVLQVALFLTIRLCGSDSFFFQNNKAVPLSQAVLIIAFNVVQLLVIVSTTTKFVRKTDELYMNFLLQSFGAVCLTMASVYVAIHSLAFADEPFKIDISKGNGERKDFMVIVLQFFHFSLCLMTTIGYGDIFPIKWYSRLVVTGHMLLSVLYMEIMFGLGLQLVRIDGPLVEEGEDDGEGDGGDEEGGVTQGGTKLNDEPDGGDGDSSAGTIHDPLDDSDSSEPATGTALVLDDGLPAGPVVHPDRRVAGSGRAVSAAIAGGAAVAVAAAVASLDAETAQRQGPTSATPWQQTAAGPHQTPRGFDYSTYRRQRWGGARGGPGRTPGSAASMGMRRRRRMSSDGSLDSVGHITVREIFTQEKQLHELNRRNAILYELLKKEGKMTAAVSGLLKPKPRRGASPTRGGSGGGGGGGARGHSGHGGSGGGGEMRRSTSAHQLSVSQRGLRSPESAAADRRGEGTSGSARRAHSTSGQTRAVATRLFGNSDNV